MDEYGEMLLIQKIIKNKVIRGAYLAWFSVTLFYFYQYILRVSPGMMVDQLRYEFSIRAEQFATLGFLYLTAYALLQVPLGIIVDKVGVRKTVLTSIVLCIIGSLLFATTNTFYIAQFSRVLIGAGSGCAFMCSIKIIADHFPPGKRGFLMGATLTFGTIGALVSGKLVLLINENYGWRMVLYSSAALGVLVFISALLLIRKDTEANIQLNEDSAEKVLKTVGNILRHKNIMIYAILAIGLYTPLSALADLWGTAFLKQKFSLTQSDAAYAASMMYLGLGIGSLILPWLSEKYKVLNRAIFFCGIMILMIFAIILYGPMLSREHLIIMMVLLGFFCGAEMMCFTGALFFAGKKNSGEIIGVVNTLNMLGSALLQQFIGILLDKQWDHTYDEMGMRHYSTEQFINSLSILVLVVGGCCVISIALRFISKPQRITSR
jgi:sugar phosphate permease